MQFIMYSVLLVYALPILWVLLIVLLADGGIVQEPADLIRIANAYFEAFFGPLRDIMGAALVPFLVVFAVPEIKKGSGVPRETITLVVVLVSLFVLIMVAFGWVNLNEVMIKDTEGANWEQLSGALGSYGHETLTYVALVTGVSIRSKRKQ